MTVYAVEWAWLPDGPVRDVRIAVAGGRISRVETGVARRPGDLSLPGIVLPGFADTHSHAFHRALRGRTHGGGGSFWTWRDAMYAVAERLDPDSYFALARATFAELALAGVTSVGEFHYLHHGAGGVHYAEPNAMGEAVVAAAGEAGLRITLLDACYLTGGLAADGPRPLTSVQERFSDGTADAWAERVAGLADGARVRIGAAVHSVRAVPREQLAMVAAAGAGRPLHVHLSEQPAENEQCLAAYGVTPTRLLRDAGALGPATTAVHATHLTGADIADLGAGSVSISLCPTTERDLGDGIGPARRLAAAGCPIVLGSDQHASSDLIEEARALEADERLASGERGRFAPAQLVDALTVAGHRSLGWPDAGRIEPGARADLVAVRLDTVRTAGVDPGQVVFAAGAPDVDTVVADGELVVTGGRHHLGDVARLLAESIDPLWR